MHVKQISISIWKGGGSISLHRYKIVKMENEKSISELEREQRELSAKIHKLRMAQIQEEAIRKQQWYNDNIEGNVYYSDKTTWGGYDHYMSIIKPISCNDWNSYGTCKIKSIEVYYNRDMSIKEIRHNYDPNMRYDMFETHCKKCTPDLYNQFMDKILKETIQMVEPFKLSEDE